MPKFEVRVTRDLDDQDVDIDVEAPDWEEAKRRAIAEVAANSHAYFGPVPPPEFYVRGMDDDECAHRIES